MTEDVKQQYDAIGVEVSSTFVGDIPLQRTKEWHNARKGKITASGVYELMTSGKGKDEVFGKTAMGYLLERFTSGMVDEEPIITSQAMQWGIDNEDRAKEVYREMYADTWGSKQAEVEEFGFIDKGHYGCSPDGIIVDYEADEGKMLVGCVEIKCPFDSSLHVEMLLTNDIPAQWKNKHYAQIQMQMLITNTRWCDYVSYDPRIRDWDKKIKVIRIDRDDKFITELEMRLEKAKGIFAEWSKKLETK
jgi:exodeoxyribonuclease (lambda-induced)